MEKTLLSLEHENVSYVGKKFKFQKKFKNLTFLMATFTLLFFSFTASASHIRYLNLTWRPVSGRTVEFKFSYAQAGSSIVGSTINFVINTGVGNVTIPTRVTSNNPSENYFYTEGTVQYTYPVSSVTNYTASFSSCCRISTLVNNRDGSVYVGTIVNVGTGNSSPIATLPPVVNVSRGVIANFTLPANDPDGDVLSYRLATPSEMGGGSNPSGLSVNSSTGLVTYNTASTSINQLYSAAIIVSDGKTSITVDFIIRITQQSIAPIFDYLVTPASGTVFQVSPGQPVNFNLRATDSDVGDNVSLSGVGIPLGAVTSPSLPRSGNPVQSSFSWTPTSSNLGTNVINFIAQDNQGVQTTSSVTIQVSLKPSFNSPPTPINNSQTFVEAGTPVNLNIQASDPDPNDRVQIISTLLPIGASLSSTLPTTLGNPTSTSLSWTPTTAQWGLNTFNFTARDTYGDQTNHKFDYIVNTPPVITSTSPSTNLVAGQLFTYNVTASDLDVPFGDELEFTSTQLPSWLSIVDNGNGTATLSGTPQISDAGSFSLTILAEDTYHHDGGVDSEILNFVVVPCNTTLNATIFDVSCSSSADGSINLAVNGGTAPFSYAWSSGATSKDLVGLAAGNYTVTVTDANNCVEILTVTVLTTPDVTLPIVLTQNRTIQLDAAGNASITAAAINNGSSDNCAIASVVLDKTSFTCENVGANTVTLTVTDASGNVSIATALVTVEDKISPTILKQNQIIQLDAAGNANITAAAINNGSSDNCAIASVVLDKTSFTCENVGANTVTLTVTDVNGNVSTATAVVTVEDSIKPTVITQNQTIQLDAAGNASITASAINNGSSDNCAIASVVLDKTSFDCSNVGSNTVTLTVTDVIGNMSTATAVVTVEDNIKPTVITQNQTIQLDAAGNASITAADINNGSSDNCSIATISLDKTAFNCANVGSNTVTLTVTDINGNVTTATAVVTVEDKIAPIIKALAFQEICFVASNTYSLPTLTATDNCSVANVNYVLNGATSRTGTGTDASGTLNTGLTTISWTVTDVNGNVSTSSNDIRIWPLPVLSITPSNANAFCNEVSLTPSSSIPAVAYRWMYNNTLFSTSEVLKLSIANADGNYQLFVTDIHGCVNTQIASYNFQKQGTVSSYTILGIREVKLGENNKVLSGSVGAMGYKGKIDIKKNSSVAAAGAFVKAASIKVQSPSNVPTKIYAPVVTSLPTMQYFTGSTKNLAKVTASTNNATLTGNYRELTVKSGKTVTLTGNLFGKVEIEEGATVTFTSPVINIQNLDVEGSSKSAYTNVLFSTDAVVKVSDKVDIERRSNINPTGKKVIFYVGSMKDHGKYNSNSHDDDDKCPSRGKDHKDDDDDDDHEGEYGNGEFKVNGGESIVNASVYVPTGKIKVNGGEKSTTSMTGMFIAEKVESSEKNVNWNGFSCSAALAAPQILAVNSVNTAKGQMEVNFKLIEEPSKLVAYPNPFARQTTVSFSIPYQEDNAVLDIYDLKGTKIHSLFKGNANAQTTYEVQFNGQNISAGTYFFRLITSKEVKNFKVIMED